MSVAGETPLDEIVTVVAVLPGDGEGDGEGVGEGEVDEPPPPPQEIVAAKIAAATQARTIKVRATG